MIVVQDRQSQRTTWHCLETAQGAQGLKTTSSIATQTSASPQHVALSGNMARKTAVNQGNKIRSPKRISPKRTSLKVSPDGVVKKESQLGRQATRSRSKTRTSRLCSAF